MAIRLSNVPATQVPTPGVATIDISKLATDGSGTYVDPWTGWQTPLDALFAPNLTFYFPSGVYGTDGSLNYGQYAHCSFIGEAGTVLLYTGPAGGTIFDFTSTHATTNVDGEFGEHEATYGIKVKNFILDGDGLADVGMFAHSIHHSWFESIWVRNVVDTKFHFQFQISNTYVNLRATRRVGDSTSDAPEDVGCVTGMLLDHEPGSPINTVQACVFIGLKIEFCSGVGLDMTVGANQNVFLGGAVQVSGSYGIKCNGNGNTFTMDCEFNTGYDFQFNGNYNTALNCLATGTIGIGNDTDGATPNGNEIRGGVFNSIDIQQDCIFTLVDKPAYQFIDSTGQFRNRSNFTTIIGAPHVYGVATKWGAGAVLADKIISKANTEFAPGSGPVIISPDGTRYRIDVANGGTLSTTAVTDDTVLARSDNFSDNAIGQQWYKGSFQATPASSVTVAETGGQLSITLPNSTAGNNYRGLVGTPHDLADGGSERIKFVSKPSGTSYQARFSIGQSGRNCLFFFMDGTNLAYGLFSGGSFSSIASVTFNAVNHLYWRLRRDGDDVVAEHSPDASSWTELGTSTGTPFSFSNLITCIEAGSTGSTTFDAPVIFDDYVFDYS